MPSPLPPPPASIPWNDDVGMLHGGGDVSVVGRVDVVLVLVHHPVYVPPTLADVSLQAACQSHVGVCLNENLKKDGRCQCCGSMTFWCGSGSGSGSADPCLLLMNPDPAFSSLTFELPTKQIFFISFFTCYLLKLHLHHSSKVKNIKI